MQTNMHCYRSFKVSHKELWDTYSICNGTHSLGSLPELDMIETVEKNKEGYESDVSFDGDSDDCQVLSPFNDDDSNTAPSTEDEEEDGGAAAWKASDEADRDVILHGVAPSNDASDRRTRSSRSKKKYHVPDEDDLDLDEEEEEERNKDAIKKPKEPKPKLTSTRKFFGAEEDVYIMDAKSIGNIGRYLNHSCRPNIFVQNCFVDTHDLRFPWVAFFAMEHIRAGQELCWDYCYIVDQVQGKEIYCQCGAQNCRGRLL